MSNLGTSTTLIDLSNNALKVKELQTLILDLEEKRAITDDREEKRRITRNIANKKVQLRNFKAKLGYAGSMVRSEGGHKRFVHFGGVLYVHTYSKRWIPEARRYQNKWIKRVATKEDREEWLKLKGGDK